MTSDDAEPTVPTPSADPTRILPAESPAASQTPPSSPDATTPLTALKPPSVDGATAPLPSPGVDAAYRQSNGPTTNQRSVTQRSFGRPQPQEPSFRPVYPGQAWPTQRPAYQPSYTPPPPPDWHNQQAHAYTPDPPQKGNRIIAIAAAVALIIGIVAGAGAAATVVAIDNNNPVAEQPGPPVGTGADPKIRSGSVSAVASTLLPSVVQLKVEGSDNTNATGSGFVIDNAGHILTNNHVVASAAQGGSIQVLSEKGKTLTARLVGRSPVYDLAVVHVSGLEAPSVQFGRSDLAIVGQDVVAIGSPLGLAGTVTSGIISAKNRPVTTGDEASGETSFISALQTDAAINPGNSGGPLVDMNARVIGVNSAIATVRGSEQSGNIGLGFAIPIDQARRTAQQLIATGKASYPVIGAQVDMQFEGGARVSRVEPASPALRAGLRVGDVITSINNLAVASAEELIVAIRTHQPGESVRLVYERGGKARSVTVTLGQQTG
ncbi:trypsin-like peptidase domain-containing protein [Kribbella sp. NPDC002412]